MVSMYSVLVADCEDSSQARENVWLLVCTVGLNGDIVDTEWCEWGNGPLDVIDELVSSSIDSWDWCRVVCGEEGNWWRWALRCELYVNVVALDIGVSIEDDIKVKLDPIADYGRVWSGCALSNVIKSLWRACTPLDWRGCWAESVCAVKVHLDWTCLRCDCLPVFEWDIHGGGRCDGDEESDDGCLVHITQDVLLIEC